MVAPAEHAFAPYLKIIGKGPNMSRPFTQGEAQGAMRMIIAGDVEPEQLGAFLLLLRYRGETPEELAGFIEAAREAIGETLPPVTPDIDWPSYADRHRQQPWFILSALLLAQHGTRIFMHGIKGEGDGYAPTRPALKALGIEPCATMAAVAENLQSTGFAYMGLETFLPTVEALFGLRPVLGLRTLVNTFARAINPLLAPCQLQGVVHPPYRDAHQSVAKLLSQPSAIVFKGGGGEVQRNPLKVCRVAWTRDGQSGEENWPALLSDVTFDWRDEDLSPARIVAVWKGEILEPAVEAAIVGTSALALHAMGKAPTPSAADQMAQQMWSGRKI
ncbi:MAG: glycosyl transferase family protein [Rhodospirillales bacterium]|jgi:anthranilate phosphoribosyltransferase|nr:glycosyl transferase family protein [Rhodospirillales bacterium]MBT4040953.1 glycosyl transferase family protein [Rhodospirillales bacterium]MBT4625645.1 glycosyl transferase family protein [Rhodospirillales bacterium]MBT5350186.1 glycosyl transferase family protein [Rhodospirillales bacterium]MBT5522032.1 glycosyl transferase family protein [Rhodospirillales bacterium]